MKKIYCILILTINTFSAQCQCPSTVNLNTQLQITNFKNKYSHCPKISRLLISKDVTDLNPLYTVLDTISVHIGIDNTQLDYIDLSHFNIETAEIYIRNNNELDSITLNANTMKNRIILEDNTNIKKINSHLGISSEFYIWYFYRPSPDTIIFNNLSNDFVVNKMDAYGNIILSGERFQVTKELKFGRNNINTTFNNIYQFIDIDSIDNALFFELDIFDFEGIENIAHISNLSTTNIQKLSINSFSESSINFESLTFWNCPSITSFMPMAKCTTKSLFVGELDSLPTLDGVFIRDTANSVRLIGNKILSDISIVESIDTFTLESIQGLTLTNNPLLSTCDYEIICKTINNNNNSNKITIKDNDGNCKSKEILQQACIVNTDDFRGEISYAYANKTLDVHNCLNCKYKVIDINGRQLKHGNYIESIDFALYPIGMYFIHLTKNDKTSVVKLFSY